MTRRQMPWAPHFFHCKVPACWETRKDGKNWRVRNLVYTPATENDLGVL